jgi:hypothetical protein
LFSVPVKSTDDLADYQEPGSAASRENGCEAGRKDLADPWQPGSFVFKLNYKII